VLTNPKKPIFMLQILRKKAQSPLIQIIVVIIALVFIFWGVGTNSRNSNQAAISVNGEDISFQQYQQAYDRAYQQLSNQFGGNVPKGMVEAFGLKQQVINQLIQTALLRQGATAMGIVVSGDEIRTYIQSMVQFQENGAFSMDRYKAVLAANRMAPAKFEQSMRSDHLAEVASREISRFGSIATDFEIQDIYSQINEKIAVKYTRISPADYTGKVMVDDGTLNTWFETVKDKYKTEPRLKLNYLVFSYAEIGRKVTIDQAKVEEYYRNNLDSYKVPEQRHARHILFKAGEQDSDQVHQEKAAKAAEVLKLLQNGGKFSTLAKEYSEDTTKNAGGDLGFFPAGKMVPAFDEVVFAMQPGTISEVVKTPFGYHIIKLEGIKPAVTQTLAEVTSKITETLQNKEAENLAFQVANDAYEAIIGAGSLAKYAESNPNLNIHRTDFFTKKDAPADLKNDPEFFERTFELDKGELSSLIKGKSGYAILFAEDKKEPEVPLFAEVKTTLEKDYRKTKSEELAQAAAKDLLSVLRTGKPFDSAAQEKGLIVKESGLLSQNTPEEAKSDFPAPLLQKAFLLSASAPLPEQPGRAGEDFYVYSFVERQIPTMPENSDEMKKYRENLQRFKQQQLLSAWLRNLETNAKITKHPSL
jgi:peptidyl-prolyl cis-trans isomerase D